jgi:NADP-dependent 3-hydroxy acid dehydrogenase YdfG
LLAEPANANFYLARNADKIADLLAEPANANFYLARNADKIADLLAARTNANFIWLSLDVRPSKKNS